MLRNIGLLVIVVVFLVLMASSAFAAGPNQRIDVWSPSDQIDPVSGKNVLAAFAVGTEDLNFLSPWTPDTGPVQIWMLDVAGSKYTVGPYIPYAGMKVYEGYAFSAVDGDFTLKFQVTDTQARYHWDLDVADEFGNWISNTQLSDGNTFTINLPFSHSISSGEPFGYHFYATASTPTVPEPGSILALGTGLIGLGSFCLRRRK